MHLAIASGVRIEQTRRRLAKLQAEGLIDRITPATGRTNPRLVHHPLRRRHRLRMARATALAAIEASVDLLCLAEFGYLHLVKEDGRSCCYRFSPSGGSARRPPWPPTPPSANGTRPSKTPGSAHRSPTGSASAARSSRPAPAPTATKPPRANAGVTSGEARGIAPRTRYRC
ncbi:hypothetical protein [Streptomyces cadmiisoli]|uniref:hypothetical protein n=1 Tax=Streptomyces cadmiisoli TaxID=2184053 RepID=UPI001FEB167E|nr:hypothetical protein [Streptomyces cadmiisoli]